MHNRWSFRRRSTWALVAAPVLAIASLTIAAGPAAATRGTGAAPRVVQPNPVNELDCNGWSAKYQSVVPNRRFGCVDPRGKKGDTTWYSAAGTYKSNGRFMDNGHYVGHDEPSVKFLSSAPNSANTMTYFMQVPRDPALHATNNGKVVDYGELSPAPWFGLPLCDPNSYPLNPCAPDQDSNTGSGLPSDAGSAFMELQFYPPGFAPFADSISCSATRWCAAMTIDSLEATFNFQTINNNCPEPVNFAYLQTNGKPAGPPGPQNANAATFAPNAHTLLIRSGDVLKISITDPSAGFTTTVKDLSTGQTGTMTASAANGFMNTNGIVNGQPGDCSGSPFTFHAEYNTAAQQNQVPWAALEGGVLMEQEIGHGEVCTSLIHKHAVSLPGFLTDSKIFDTCVGGSEGGTGEGSCNLQGICTNPTTEGTTGPIACPSRRLSSGQLCEFADGICLPQGSRTVTLGGHNVTETSPVNLCEDNRFQNGDLDFDGVSYQKTTWPNGSANVPTSFRYAGPFDKSGHPYPKVQIESDVAGSEFLCNIFNGLNCDAPPLGAKFYPFWTLTNKSGQGIGKVFAPGTCIWNFGNIITKVTTNALGRDAQYGLPNIARFGGTLISGVRSNPELGAGCAVLKP